MLYISPSIAISPGELYKGVLKSQYKHNGVIHDQYTFLFK